MVLAIILPVKNHPDFLQTAFHWMHIADNKTHTIHMMMKHFLCVSRHFPICADRVNVANVRSNRDLIVVQRYWLRFTDWPVQRMPRKINARPQPFFNFTRNDIDSHITAQLQPLGTRKYAGTAN